MRPASLIDAVMSQFPCNKPNCQYDSILCRWMVSREGTWLRSYPDDVLCDNHYEALLIGSAVDIDERNIRNHIGYVDRSGGDEQLLRLVRRVLRRNCR